MRITFEDGVNPVQCLESLARLLINLDSGTEKKVMYPNMEINLDILKNVLDDNNVLISCEKESIWNDVEFCFSGPIPNYFTEENIIKAIEACKAKMFLRIDSVISYKGKIENKIRYLEAKKENAVKNDWRSAVTHWKREIYSAYRNKEDNLINIKKHLAIKKKIEEGAVHYKISFKTSWGNDILVLPIIGTRNEKYKHEPIAFFRNGFAPVSSQSDSMWFSCRFDGEDKK